MVAGTVTSASRVGAMDWDVVIGDRFIAAIAAPADVRALTALAAVMDDAEVRIEQLVQAMPAASASDPDDQGFAVVLWPLRGAPDVTAVVRGDAVVDLDSPGGSRRFDARGIRPWHLAEFRDVTGVRLTGADAPVQASGTAIGVAVGAVAPARVGLRASDVVWSPVERVLERRPDAAGRPTDDADTVLRDNVLDATVAVASDPEAVHDPDDDRRPDVLTPHATSTFAPSTFAPGAPPRVRIGAGAARSVTVPILVGRRPLAPRAPSAAAAAPELVPVRSPTGVISGTHLELRIEGERLVATDLRSTNGTVIRTTTGMRRMRAGESIVVMPGSSLDLGDGTIIEVLPASDDAPHPTRTDRPPS
ncbi:FHA domain-containing protein [Agromyces sp. PvR057]|uniref:FHA domain-containing protein n=1 Tax=Agromyces sp. PvR057 TaxID=3156403 RepID=UPI000E247BD9